MAPGEYKWLIGLASHDILAFCHGGDLLAGRGSHAAIERSWGGERGLLRGREPQVRARPFPVLRVDDGGIKVEAGRPLRCLAGVADFFGDTPVAGHVIVGDHVSLGVATSAKPAAGARGELADSLEMLPTRAIGSSTGQPGEIRFVARSNMGTKER